MLKLCRHIGVAVAVITALLFAAVQYASAQSAKKPTYDEAWAKCKAEISAKVAPNESGSTAARHAAGGACMKKYGYRLKKSSM